MRVKTFDTIKGSTTPYEAGQSGFTIGRGETCQVQLNSRFVSRVHARVERAGDGWEIEVPDGAEQIEIDGQPLAGGQRRALSPMSRLRIATFEITLDAAPVEVQAPEEVRINELVGLVHSRLLRRMDLRAGSMASTEVSAQRVEQVNGFLDELLLGDLADDVFESDLTPLIVGRFVRWKLETQSTETRGSHATDLFQSMGYNHTMEQSAGDQLVAPITQQIGFVPEDLDPDRLVQTQRRIDEQVRNLLPSLLNNAKTYAVLQFLKKQLYDIIFGLGPLQDLIEDTRVSEIMVVHPELIYVEMKGRVVRTGRRFLSPAAAVSAIERIVAPLGRRIDRASPLVDARLRDGSRVNAVIEPLAIKGPCITIRKFPIKSVGVEDMVRWGAVTRQLVELLRASVEYRANMIVAGGTGSGKTTLLNVLSGMIPPHERVVTIEDAAELRMQQEHVVSLETRPASAEGTGAKTIRDLVKNALRMRPDRIIVGECRGEETIDMLQAMNTGHSGSMTTLHANSGYDVISRLETLVLMGANLPLPAVRRQIAEAVNLIVYVQRLTSGRRLVSQVAEVTRIHPHTGEVEVRDIMNLDTTTGQPVLKPTGYMPTFLGEMVERGFLKLETWFGQEPLETKTTGQTGDKSA
ncbi:MAG: FHA domain-containing protein [Phycisphaera sp.]|nr:FHA domain-containing protein [Phycisphaera sp.]